MFCIWKNRSFGRVSAESLDFAKDVRFRCSSWSAAVHTIPLALRNVSSSARILGTMGNPGGTIAAVRSARSPLNPAVPAVSMFPTQQSNTFACSRTVGTPSLRTSSESATRAPRTSSKDAIMTLRTGNFSVMTVKSSESNSRHFSRHMCVESTKSGISAMVLVDVIHASRNLRRARLFSKRTLRTLRTVSTSLSADHRAKYGVFTSVRCGAFLTSAVPTISAIFARARCCWDSRRFSRRSVCFQRKSRKKHVCESKTCTDAIAVAQYSVPVTYQGISPSSRFCRAMLSGSWSSMARMRVTVCASPSCSSKTVRFAVEMGIHEVGSRYFSKARSMLSCPLGGHSGERSSSVTKETLSMPVDAMSIFSRHRGQSKVCSTKVRISCPSQDVSLSGSPSTNCPHCMGSTDAGGPSNRKWMQWVLCISCGSRVVVQDWKKSLRFF